MDEYTSSVKVWGLTCTGFPEEVGRARRWTRAVLGGLPCEEDAVAIVSELATNALTHTASGSDAGTFHIALIRSGPIVAISVTDIGGKPGAPHITYAGLDQVGGRGLHLVAAFANRLGTTGDEHGRTVTAELHLPQRPIEPTNGRRPGDHHTRS